MTSYMPHLTNAWENSAGFQSRLTTARHHLMVAARRADEQGLKESHRAILNAVAAIDDAEEAANAKRAKG